MSDFEEDDHFDYKNFIMCHMCKNQFSFQYAKDWDEKNVFFKDGNHATAYVACPFCGVTGIYPSGLWLSPAVADYYKELKKIKLELKQKQDELEELKDRQKFYEMEVDRLRKNNDKLTDDNTILSHAVQDLMTQTSPRIMEKRDG